jgi:hypothetical protein
MYVSDEIQAPATLPRGKSPPPSTHWIDGWMGSRASKDYLGKGKTLAPALNLTQFLGSPASGPVIVQTHYSCTCLKMYVKRQRFVVVMIYLKDKVAAPV